MRSIHTVGGLVFTAFILPTIANAQTATSNQPPAQTAQTGSEQSMADTGATAEAEGITDIIVTATRREERLQKVPITVTALNSEAIGVVDVKDVRSLTQIAPGFNGGRASMVLQPTIRGVGSTGTSVGDESNVATYIDGVYQAEPYSNQIELVEVERVEIIRGPQGTVFGRNATGGLINVITPDPSFTSRGWVSGRYARMREDSSEYDFRGYVTSGLSSNVAFDFAGMYRGNSGYVTDLTGGRPQGRASILNLRSKLLFNATDTLKFILTGAFIRSRDQISATHPYNRNTLGRSFGAIVPEDFWQTSGNVIPINFSRRLDLSLRGSKDLGFATLEFLSAFSDTKVHQRSDSDASNIPLAYTDVFPSSKYYNNEIRLLSNSNSRLKWVGGLYAFWLDGAGNLELGSGSTPNNTVVTRLKPVVSTASYSAFAEGTYSVTDDLFLTLGGRYSYEKRTFSTAANGIALPFGIAKTSFKRFTYRTALRYEFDPSANIYASFSTGYKSGVFNAYGTSPIATNPEQIKAAEVGLKADPASWLRTNFSLFRYWYDDLQVTSRAPNGGFILQNAATAKIYGGEAEITAIPLKGLNFRAALSYLHATFENFPGAQAFVPQPGGGNVVTTGSASGKDMIRAPRYTLTLSGSYAFDVGSGSLKVGGNVFLSDKFYFDFQNAYVQPSYKLVAGEIRWTNSAKNIDLFLFGTNLTNERIYQAVTISATGSPGIFERPRRVGVGAEFRF